MKLTNEQKIKLAAKFNEKKYRQNYSVEIFRLGSPRFGELNLRLKFGLNWDARGTVSAVSANTFIKQLMEAKRLVEKLNSS